MKRNIIKFLFYGLGLCAGLVFINNTILLSSNMTSSSIVFALGNTNIGDTGGAQGKTDTLEGFTQMLNIVLKLLYTLLWPLLAIAGVSMDNGMVMGEFFHMDIALYKFWNIIKNFANFGLGFIFIASILMYFLNIKQDKFDPKKILPRLLIAGISIQASRFIVVALLDISTIATYGIGFLPLQVMENTDADQRVLMWNGTFRMGDGNNSSSKMPEIEGTYGCGADNQYIGCVLSGSTMETEAFQTLVTTYNKNPGNKVSPDFCVYNGKLIESTLADVSDVEKLKTSGGKGQTKIKDTCKTVSELAQMGKGITGPLFGLYGSILNVGSIAIESSNKTVAATSLAFMIKALIAIALAIPLFALAVILIVRVVILWMIIGFSPLIALAEAFDLKLAGDKGRLKEIIGLIFLPVVAVFATSLSILFMSVISSFEVSTNENGNVQSTLNNSMGIEQTTSADEKSTCYMIKSIGVDLCFDAGGKNSSYSAFFNLFSYMLINFCGIALMWAIIFAALKTSAITNGIVTGIEGFAKDMLKAAPIVPMPGGMMSAGGVKEGFRQLQGMPNRLMGENYRNTLLPHLESLETSIGGDSRAINNKFGEVAKSGDETKFAEALSEQSKLQNSSLGSQSNAKAAIDKFYENKGKTAPASLNDAFADKTFQQLLDDKGIDARQLYSSMAGNAGKAAHAEFDEIRKGYEKPGSRSLNSQQCENIINDNSKTAYIGDESEGIWEKDDRYYYIVKDQNGKYKYINEYKTSTAADAAYNEHTETIQTIKDGNGKLEDLNKISHLRLKNEGDNYVYYVRSGEYILLTKQNDGTYENIKSAFSLDNAKDLI